MAAMKLQYRPYKFKRGPFKGIYTFLWLPRRHWLIRFLLWLISPITKRIERRKREKAKQELMQSCNEIVAAQLWSMKKGLELLESLEPYTANKLGGGMTTKEAAAMMRKNMR